MTGQLTQREVEILAAYAECGLIKLVAIELGLSEQTVKNHLVNSYRKLRVDRAVGAWAKLGWLRVPEEVSWHQP